MTYTSNYPEVGDALVGGTTAGIPIGRSWTVTRVWKGGDRVTVRSTDGGPAQTRQACRQRFGSWKLGYILVQFSRPATKAKVDAAAESVEAQPSYQAVVLDTTPAHTQPTTTGDPDWDDRKSALDLVRPLVEVALKLFRESLDVRASVTAQKANPDRSPRVAQAYQRYLGATEVLSAMWIELGAEKMNPGMARRAVEAEHLAQATAAQAAMTDSPEQMLADVRSHAEQHYTEGWDVIVEAWEDDELSTEIANAPVQTSAGAIEHIRQIVEVLEDVRQDRTPIAGWHY
jgi:hypothetical protein